MNSHNKGICSVNNIFMEQYPYFISKIIEKRINEYRIKRKDFSIMQIIRVLECLSDGDKSFNKFYQESKFGLKRSFLNYIDLCVAFGFISKNRVGPHMMYAIREKGKIFLDLFRNG